MTLVLAIIFVAALTRCTFGFGEALIAMPPLVLLLGLETAAPLVALLSISTAVVILAQDWGDVHFAAARRLVPAAVLGIAAGLLLMDLVDERLVVAALGALLVAFAGYRIGKPDVFELTTDRFAPAIGLVAGVLAGAYNTPGPPLVIYGAMRRWSARQFRATMQAFFLPASVVVVAGHTIAGRITQPVLIYYAAGLPVTFVCLFLGRAINRRFTTENFLPVLNGLLLLLGGLLLANALWPGFLTRWTSG